MHLTVNDIKYFAKIEHERTYKGTVRFSVSAFNTMDEIYTVSRLMRQMCLEVKGK